MSVKESKWLSYISDKYSLLVWMRYYVAVYIAIAIVTNYSGYKYLQSSRLLIW